MRKPSEVIINGKTLEEILENHLHWLKRDVDGWKEMRANLDGADISNTDLRFTNLKYASLNDVNFYKSDLRGVDLRKTSLQHTNLSYADFREATLNDAYIFNSNLAHADFGDASLVGTYFSHLNLTMADFRGANLGWAYLHSCVFYDTDLRDSEYIPYIPLQCPSDGAFVGWKKVNNVLIKLEIPADAKRSSATTNKCRCDKAKVLGFYDNLGSKELDMTELVNDKYEKCKYVKGEMVYPDSFDEDRWNECSHGIHFFINKQDAIDYKN